MSSNNPLGSTSVSDMFLNAGNLDKALNGNQDTWIDRFGVERVSWNYIEKVTKTGELSKQAREALRRSYAEAGLNMVEGSFEKGGVLVNSNDVLLHEATGKCYSGNPGTVTPGTLPTSGGFVDKSVCAVAFNCVEIQEKLDLGFTMIQAFVKTIDRPITVPKNSTVLFNGITRISISENIFTVVTGSRVYGDFIINSGVNPTICYVDGTFRPTMLLSDNRRAGIYGTIRSENPSPTGRGVFLDGNARNGKRGIISWFECDLSLRNIERGVDVEVSNPLNIDGGKSYVNNNFINISMWDVPYGYIEADYDQSNSEIAGNSVTLNYQSSQHSIQILKTRAKRNTIRGNVWDTDKTMYPSLLSNAIDIGGNANDVGGANWPSSSSNVVLITDTLCCYTGYTYGVAKQIIKPLTVFSRMGVDHGNGVEGPIVGVLGTLQGPVNIPPNSALKSIYSRTYGFQTSRVPYFIDGFILLKNPTQTQVTAQVKFGPRASDGALSTTFQVPAERVVKIDLSMVLGLNSQVAICGDGSWYGNINYASANTHEIHIQVTSLLGITVEAVILKRSGEL